jgi:hypothetical protein
VILVVSHPDDDHLAPVLDEIARLGHRAVVLDTATLPRTSTVTADYGATDTWRLGLPDGTRVELDECRSGWWRRARPPEIDDRITDPAVAAWTANEVYEALSGFWDAVPIRWVSPPRVIEQTMMKTWQLPAARAAGLRTPRTLITNSPADAKEFLAEVGRGRVICKAFSATMANWRETRLVTDAELAVLDRVTLAPVIFQEFVPASVDLRVTVVGGDVFAAAVHSQAVPYPLDFRMHLDTVRIEPTTIPAEIAAALHRLVDSAGLRYGAVDMRLTPDGEYVFLEINPAGQWLFLDERTATAVTAAVARLLCELDTSDQIEPNR